ncbi:MAG: ADOP family duplicated permease, partial [Gemmatimonadota bacterium]
MIELPPRVRRLFRLPWRSASRIREDVDEEIAFHLDMRTEELVGEGMDPREARERAELEFGHVDDARRAMADDDTQIERRARWRAWWDDLRSDVAVGVRGLRKRPGFATAAVVALALGIGGTTAVFSVVRSVLIEPLPYEDPGRLVRLYQYDIDEPGPNFSLSPPHFQQVRSNVASLGDVATVYTYQETGADVTAGDRTERVRLLSVSSGYFRVLREEPSRGRTFTRDEEAGSSIAIVSQRLLDRLGTAADRVGRTIELDGEAYTVVGVMPEEFEDPLVGAVDVWVPEDLSSGGAQYPGNHYLSVIGRLEPGVALSQARAEIATLQRALDEQWPGVADEPLRMVALHEDLTASARPALFVLFGAVACLLLLACVNVANLMLVRAIGREREMALRATLGAGRGRTARQLLTESMILALAGGAAGVLIAFAGVEALVAIGRDAIPRAAEVGVDGPVLGFAAAAAVLTGFAFGLAPAWRTARIAPARVLREGGGRGGSEGPGRIRLRGALVAAQVALAVVLLVGAAVLATSVYRLSHVDLGVRTDEVLTFELNLPAARYDAPARARLHRGIADGLANLPGVSAVGVVNWLPASGGYNVLGTFPVTGPRAQLEEARISTQHRVVEGDYFEALDIPLLEGRLFDERDGPDGEPVAVVSRSLAQALFPGMSAIGHRIEGGGREREIIGVVGDVAVDVEGERAPYVYHAYAQMAASRNWAMRYVVAADADAAALTPAVRRTIASEDPLLVVHRPETLTDMLGRGRSTRRFAFVLMAVFAGIALILAMLGLYGVLAYSVGERTREIGIRMALGAEPGRVAVMIVRHGLMVTTVGLAFGIAGALALGRALSSLVFRTEPTDPLI